MPAAPALDENVTVAADQHVAIGEDAPAAAVVRKNAKPAFNTLQTIEDGLSRVSSAFVQRVIFPTPAAPVAEENVTVAADQHTAIGEDAPAAAVTRETAKPAFNTLQTIENGLSQVSSAFVQRVVFPMPAAPAVDENVTVAAGQHVAIGEDAPAAAVTRETAEPAFNPLQVIDNGLSQVSSAIALRVLFQIPSPPVNETPIAVPVKQDVAVNYNLHSTVADRAPVLIGGQTLYSPSMLMPLDIGPQPIDAVSSGLVSSNNGPSAESLAFNEGSTEKPTSSSAPLPLLVTAQYGFSMEMLKPMSRTATFSPASPAVSTPIFDGNYCDPNFVGPPIRFSQTVELKLDDLLNQLNARFGVNFVIGPEIAKLPLNVKAGSIPWNVLLKSQLYVSGVRATCIDNNTIELVRTDKVADLEKARTDSEVLQSKYIKLKYLQPSSGGNKNIAGQSSGGSSSGSSGGASGDCQQQGSQGGQTTQILPQRCKFERLMTEIRQIIGLNNQTGGGVPSVGAGQQNVTLENVKRPYVGQVPGRNMLLVNASVAQLKDIDELIRRADVPPFQVVIKALVYTANENKLKDIGAQASAIFGTGNLNKLGGITSQLPSTTSNTGQLNPGGVRELGPGFPQPGGSGDSVFGLSAIVGTAQFSLQVQALEQNGVLSLKSRPFATVLDGDTTDLTVGRQIPVIIQAANNIGGSPGTLQILQAANLLSVTPHVIDDENGNPTAVNLELQLESNDVDTSVVSQGVPSVSVKSIQSNFILNQEQTAILGGFTVDSDNKTVTKTPGLGDIPILGELFKRRVRTSQINRLYFAISVTVIPYGGPIEPVKVPGANPDPPSLTPTMLDRSNKAEPKTVVPTPTPSAASPKKDTDH